MTKQTTFTYKEEVQKYLVAVNDNSIADMRSALDALPREAFVAVKYAHWNEVYYEAEERWKVMGDTASAATGFNTSEEYALAEVYRQKRSLEAFKWCQLDGNTEPHHPGAFRMELRRFGERPFPTDQLPQYNVVALPREETVSAADKVVYEFIQAEESKKRAERQEQMTRERRTQTAQRNLRDIYRMKDDKPYVGPVFGKSSLLDEWNEWSKAYPDLVEKIESSYVAIFEAGKTTPKEETTDG